MVTNGILRWVGWGEFITCATDGHFGTSVCRTKAHPSLPCFRADAGGSRLVLSGPQASYAGGLASLYYRDVTEPHLAACDKIIARFHHHHLNPVGIGRVVLCLRLCFNFALVYSIADVSRVHGLLTSPTAAMWRSRRRRIHAVLGRNPRLRFWSWAVPERTSMF